MTIEGIKKRCNDCGELTLLKDMQKRNNGGYGTSNICKKCASKYQIEWRKKKVGELLDNEEDERHGTYYGYTLGCRCDRCRDALSRYTNDYRRRKLYASYNQGDN